MKLLLLIAFVLPVLAFSQSIQSDHTDDFGKVRRIATTRVEFSGITTSLGGTLTVKAQDSVMYMNLYFRVKSATSTSEKSKAIIKLDNEEVLLLTNIGNYKTLSTGQPGVLLFSLTNEERQKLKAHKVISLSIETNKEIVDIDVNERHQKAFMKTISLLEAQVRS